MMLLLSSCSSKVTVKTAYVYPPQAYLMACERSPFVGATYGDVIEHLILVTAERDKCASQVDGLNEWLEKNQKSQ